MSVSTVRPSSTTHNGLSTPSTGTRHGCTSDDSDSTYVNLNASPFSNALGLAFTPPSITSGSLVLYGVVRVRADSGGDTVTTLGTLANLGGTYGSATIYVSGSDPSTVNAAGVFSSDKSTMEVSFWGGNVEIYEVYFDVYYVAPPSLTVSAPTGTLTDDNRPTVSWSATFDSLAPAQHDYEVKIFTDAVYGGGGFDPATSTPVAIASNSAAIPSTATLTEWASDVSLPNGTYRAYVKVASRYGYHTIYSDWEYSQFTINVSPPDPPAFSLTDQPSSGRVKIDVTPDNSPVATDGVLIERSDDGGTTWTTVDEHTGGSSYTAYDYFAPSGVSMTYRASAWNDTVSARLYSTATTHSVTSSAGWWLKHPTDETLNVELSLRSNPTVSKAARQSVSQPLGRSDAVVTTDTYGPDSGQIVAHARTFSALDPLDAILDTASVLLLSGPVGQGWADRWVVFGDRETTRLVDNGNFLRFDVTLPWTETQAPEIT